MKNSYKLATSSLLSIFGSESTKIVSSVYILVATNNFFLSAMVYILSQLPSILGSFLYPLLKFNNKKLLLLVDSTSVFLSISFAFAIFMVEGHFTKVVLVLILISLQSFIHSFRFPAFRNSINFLSKNYEEVRETNKLQTATTIFGLGFASLLGLLSIVLDLYWFIIFDGITYFISLLIVLSLRYYKVPLTRVARMSNRIKGVFKRQRFSKWTPHIFMAATSLFIFFKFVSLPQILTSLAIDVNFWTYIILATGILGSIVALYFLIPKKNNLRFDYNFYILSAIIAFFVLSYLYLSSTMLIIILFLLVSFFTNMLFSTAITNYYDLMHQRISGKSIGNLIAWTSLSRSFFSILINLSLTFILIFVGFEIFSYLLLSCFVLVCLAILADQLLFSGDSNVKTDN